MSADIPAPVLRDLLARVRGADGPDREIDLQITNLFTPFGSGPPGLRYRWSDSPFFEAGQRQIAVLDIPKALEDLQDFLIRKEGALIEPPAYTDSIDAAVALVERVLTVFSLEIGIDPSGNGAKIWWWPEGLSGPEWRGEGVSVSSPLAILDALLQCLIARAERATAGQGGVA